MCESWVCADGCGSAPEHYRNHFSNNDENDIQLAYIKFDANEVFVANVVDVAAAALRYIYVQTWVDIYFHYFPLFQFLILFHLTPSSSSSAVGRENWDTSMIAVGAYWMFCVLEIHMLWWQIDGHPQRRRIYRNSTSKSVNWTHGTQRTRSAHISALHRSVAYARDLNNRSRQQCHCDSFSVISHRPWNIEYILWP